MSFYINNNNNKRPACINANQLNNICEKVLIEATRIFDACLCRVDSEETTLQLSNFTPANPTYPLDYISTTNDPDLPVIITSTRIERSECRPNFANVTVTFTIPLIVSYIDANNNSGFAQSTITLTRNAILYVPQDSLTPITIKVQAYFSSTIGNITDSTANITYCLQVIIKVVGNVDLLIPTFGYPCLPPCQGSGVDVNCTAFFNEPLYPPNS